mgnify:CR=1 FL=1
MQQTIPGRQIVRQVVQQIPGTTVIPQPAVVCTSSQQQPVQQIVPVFAQRQVSQHKTKINIRMI